jgi:hypothetical protein
MAVIKIPKTPNTAYNPGRPANALILAHVRELERALREKGGRVKRAKAATEEEAAAYIRQLTRGLHHQTLLPEVKAGPVEVKASPVTVAKRNVARTSARRSGSPKKRKTTRRAKRARSSRRRS